MIYLFIWLHRVLVAAHGIFHCGARTLVTVYRLSCSMACRVSAPQQRIEPISISLHCKVDS